MDRNVLVAGETLVDFLPERSGSLEDVDSFERRPGGAPANVAIGLARLEHAPLFWTRVGDDPFGRSLESTLADAGIPDRFVERDPEAKTTLAFVSHDEVGDREFSFYREDTADTRLEAGRIDDETLAALEWVHVGGVTLASGPSRAATIGLLERASEAGCTTSFDPNFRPELWPDREAFERVGREALAHVDVCKATVGELERLGVGSEATAIEGPSTDANAASLARGVLETDHDGSSGPHTVFVTRGDAGAIATALARAPWPDVGEPGDGSGVVTAEHPGFDVDAVDATGAGDAFVAGVIAAARDGRSLESTLRFANAAGAVATTDAGAMTALPDRDAVAAVLERDRNRA
ncbi:carbohydrate kinase family protein [Natronolimnohabitans innermongolicus]|uniref:PfkB domain-containing protein n=1 Tax=Natronolimnohabitans innermongolicus JCM 12255 TaxID=1227499 RepID=L9XJI6_9EURY|nr:carbohydrate kinase [Natronolimnohabitans innermongolicus]ELY61924.1 PfkB domain-containing protein [Natronolimnohabitans innermongolicus JCM 12255]